MTDGTAAAQSLTHVDDLSHYYTLKKKGDKRLQGGVSFNKFMTMKQNGDFEDFTLLKDSQMQALFLQ